MEAGTVELEVSWKLNHKPETPAAQKVQVEEESGLSQQGVLPDPPALWEELWLPLPQAGQLCVLRSNDLDSSEAPRLQKTDQSTGKERINPPKAPEPFTMLQGSENRALPCVRQPARELLGTDFPQVKGSKSINEGGCLSFPCDTDILEAGKQRPTGARNWSTRCASASNKCELGFTMEGSVAGKVNARVPEGIVTWVKQHRLKQSATDAGIGATASNAKRPCDIRSQSLKVTRNKVNGGTTVQSCRPGSNSNTDGNNLLLKIRRRRTLDSSNLRMPAETVELVSRKAYCVWPPKSASAARLST